MLIYWMRKKLIYRICLVTICLAISTIIGCTSGGGGGDEDDAVATQPRPSEHLPSLNGRENT